MEPEVVYCCVCGDMLMDGLKPSLKWAGSCGDCGGLFHAEREECGSPDESPASRCSKCWEKHLVEIEIVNAERREEER